MTYSRAKVQVQRSVGSKDVWKQTDARTGRLHYLARQAVGKQLRGQRSPGSKTKLSDGECQLARSLSDVIGPAAGMWRLPGLRL